MEEQGELVAVLVCLAGVLLLVILAMDRCSFRKPSGPAPDAGAAVLLQAPAPSLGSLKELRGKAVVLEFWATSCRACRDTFPHMNRLREEFKDKPVVFISATGEGREDVEAFLRERPITGWIALDEDGRLHRAFRVRGIPDVAVIDHQGQMIVRTRPSFLYKSDIERAMPPVPKDGDEVPAPVSPR